MEDNKAEVWAGDHGLERYFGSSIKGEADIYWDNEKSRRAFLQMIFGDAERVLRLAREAQGQFSEGDGKRQGIMEAASGIRTPVSSPGAAWHPTGALLWESKDPVPTTDGSHGS